MPKKPYLQAGQIVGTHGVRGELRVQSWCDSPEVFCKLKKVYFDDAGKRAARITARPHKNVVLVKMDGVDTVTDAEALRDTVLYLARADLKLEKGQYFIEDMLGLSVRDAETGEVYGELTDVSATGANDVYHMKAADDGREILIPAIPLIVKKVDVDGGVVEIVPIKGLLNDED